MPTFGTPTAAHSGVDIFGNPIPGANRASSSSGTTFAGGSEDALKVLLEQLLSGGTAEQKAAQANINQEIATNRGARADYSKSAAFADAQGAINQQQRLALEKLIPSLVRSSEGAGTSQSSMRALLLNDAANKAAESASALGLKASVDYGNISSNLGNILSGLVKGTPVTDALLKAIDVGKGTQSSQVGAANAASSGLPTVNPVATSSWGDPFSSTKGSSPTNNGSSDAMWSSGEWGTSYDAPVDLNTGAAGASLNGWSNMTF